MELVVMFVTSESQPPVFAADRSIQTMKLRDAQLCGLLFRKFNDLNCTNEFRQVNVVVFVDCD